MGKKSKHYNKNRGLENFCLSIIRLGVYLTLFTPLIVMRRSFFPFVTPKTIYFRVLVEIIFAAYLVLAIYVPRYRPKINVLSVSVFLFVFVLILTSVLGINFERSFWSTFERMTGIFTFLHLLAFFVILSNCFRKREDWDKILTISILVGILLCFHVLSKSEISSRKGGTIGNSSFMAAYLLFDIFFALILFLGKKTSGWKFFSGISLIIFILILLTSSARAATVAFFMGIFLLFLSYLFFSGEKNLKKAGISLILFLLVLVVILGVLRPSFVTNRIDKLLKQMHPRFVVWEKAWKGFLERPLFGWGPENFNTVFLKFFNPCMYVKECGGEIWFDRAHNIVFDTLVTMGIVGFLSYLFIFAAAVIGLLVVYLKKKENLFSFFGMIVLLAIYFFQNLFVFDMISSYAVFFLSLGFIFFLIEEEELFSQPEDESSNSSLRNFIDKDAGKYLVSGSVVVLSCFLLYFGNIQPLDSAFNIVNMIVGEVTLEKKMDFFKKALNTFMEKYETREQFGQKVSAVSLGSKENREVVRSALDLAEEEMEKSIKENAFDFRPCLFLGRVYSSDYRFSKDDSKLDSAEGILKKAIELSPTNQQGYWYLTEVTLARGDNKATYDLFQKSIDLEPRLGLSHWYLAMTYKLTGKYEKALEKVMDAGNAQYPYKWKENVSDIQKVAEIYQYLGDHSNVASLYQEAVKIKPEDSKLWIKLADAYLDLGEFQKAREAAIKAGDIDPEIKPQVDEFLKNLPQ